MPAAIIAGTGIYNIPGLQLEQKIISTPYGDASVSVGLGSDSDLVFLTRHGASHSIPPHKVNYRANIKALEMLGVKRVIANYAVGSVSLDVEPLSVAALSDIIDFTDGRESTFFDGADGNVQHVEMSVPYCPNMRAKLLSLAPDHDLPMHENAVYAAWRGPRFETPAEIKMMRQFGADVVGMTGMPEVVLARELGMCFAGVAFSINWAAGVKPKIEIIHEGLDEIRAKVIQLCIATLRATSDDACEPAVLI